MSNIKLLEMLKRIQFHSASDYDVCPECNKPQYDTPEDGHYDKCELKAQIDRLEAEEKKSSPQLIGGPLNLRKATTEEIKERNERQA